MINPTRLKRAIAGRYFYNTLIAAAVIAPCFYLLGAPVFSSCSFVNRDAGHYYIPLFQWTSSQWGSGGLPLWNPQENGGYPVVADATASLFYPGKAVYALPFNFFRLHGVYILCHLLLAAGGVWLLARQWQISAAGGGFAAVAYAMAGAVSFQYCNVVFLVGAAWFPFVLLAGDRMFKQRSFFWSAVAGAVLALMTLGGDPQAAYHAGFCLAGYALIVSAQPHDLKQQSRMWRLLRSRLALLSAACGGLICLAAVQLVPSWQWTSQSNRAAYINPRNIYEGATELSRGEEGGRTASERIQTGILGEPEFGTHHDHAYQFSVAPWRIVELLWPNITGRPFPINNRWAGAIPGADRVWTPSIYLGLAPLLLGLGCLQFRGGKDGRRWMTYLLLLAGVAALGWYGPGWLLHEFRVGVLGAAPTDMAIGQPVGGVYWLMVTLLPGYAYFRYPAKLATVATLALAVLAGAGFDKACDARWKWPLRGVVVVGVLTLVTLIAATAVRPFWNDVIERTHDDAFLGPVSPLGSANDLLFALVHALLLCLILAWMFTRKSRGSGWKLALLVLTSVELCIANGWTAQVAPDALWQAEPYAAKVIAEDAQLTGPATGPAMQRVYRARGAKWLPLAWRRSGSAIRQRDGLQWDRATLSPKHHLTSQYGVITGTHTSITPHDYIAVMHAARYFGVKRSDGVPEPAPRVLDFLGAAYRITPGSYRFAGDQAVDSTIPAPPVNVNISRSQTALPRTWAVHQVVVMPPLKQPSWLEVEQRTVSVWFPGGKLRPFDKVAVVESRTAPAAIAPPLTQPSACRIQHETPTRVVIDAELHAPGLVVLSDRYDPGWKATVSSNGGAGRKAAILRTNRVMRGVALPAGRHRIEYHYQPDSLRIGAIISILAWVLLAAATLWRFSPRG